MSDEEMCTKGTNLEKAPVGKDRKLRDRLKDFAEQNGLVISEFCEKKLRWSESHCGFCACDPINRTHCPCDNVYEDMKAFNGRCLCRVLWKPEAYEKWVNEKKKQKTLIKEEKVEKTEEEILREKEIVQNVWKGLR